MRGEMSNAQNSKQTSMNVRRLSKVLFLSVLLPISAALLLDFSLGTLPVITVVAILIFIPAGAFFVIRATLDEFDKVVREVAPEESTHQDSSGIMLTASQQEPNDTTPGPH